MGVDAPLRWKTLRQVRIGVQRDAVGPQLAHLHHSARKRGRGLPRQTVNEVGVDRGVADLAGLLDQRTHRLERLLAMHRLLHIGVEVLHAKTQPVETHASQAPQAHFVDRARVDLDRHLGVGGDVEGCAQHVHQAREFIVTEEGGRAAAEVQLGQHLMATEHGHVQLDLALERLEVFAGTLVVTGDDLVARAVVADRLAKRDVHVQRQRHRGARGHLLRSPRQCLPVLARAEGVYETIGRRVGGVARAGDIQPGKQLADGVRHERFDRHGRTVTARRQRVLMPIKCAAPRPSAAW